jgi:uncharacterized surface anchored protein
MKGNDKMKKILNKIILTLMVTITGILSTLVGNVYAVTEVNVNQTNLYEKKVCDRYLKYNGVAIKTTYVVYKNGEVEYPAYCLNVDLPGVGELGSYDVNTQEKVTDVGLWRIIINGYPYKTIQELGVDTEEEAFTATKQAVYCYLFDRDINKYEANGAKGEKTLKALNQILENASKETSNQVANIVNIKTTCEDWEEDEINNKYVSKTYYVEANASFSDYTITASEFPEGTIIADTSNNEKSTFSSGEKFKVLIPISSLLNDGNFTLNVKTKLNTKPVIYGKSTLANAQNYALTAYSYEDASGIYEEKYQENKTKIKILKKDKETQESLKGVEFALLDENKNVVYSSLLTDENGEIVLSNVMPGKYFLQEINGLQGYSTYEELLEINANFNQTITVIVNNEKEEITIKENPEEDKITVESYAKQTEVKTVKEVEVVEVVMQKKLPVTGM